MNKEKEFDFILINNIPINNFNKNKVNFAKNDSNCFIKHVKASSSTQKKLSKKNIKEKYKYNKIIINNIKKYDLNQSQKNVFKINDIINKKQNMDEFI
jgi:hypothetical protein